MNQNQFLERVMLAVEGKPFDNAELEELVNKYPYCQSGHVLYYLSLLEHNGIQRYQTLRKVSAYAADRKRLKYLVDHFKFDPTEKQHDSEAIDATSEGHGNTEAIPHFISKSQLQVTTDALNDDLLSENSLQPNQKQPDNQIGKNIAHSHEDTSARSPKKSSPNLSKHQKTKQELIDEFIKNSPRISRSKTDFYDPVDYSKNSEIDKEDIVSETLAMIYFKQANYAKAISTYQKLILKVPQKSTFFAAQIEKIKEVQNLNN